MTREAPLVYLVAGEPSGDLLGARLMAALTERSGGRARFAGIGGENMAEQGLTSLVPIEELAVMGLVEVLPRLPNILRRLAQTIEDIEARRPDVVVTIDSWGFTGQIAKRLKARGSTVPRLHYVAPMVWAWKAGRAKKLAKRLDLLMTLLPNEPPYFEAHGLRTVHVGHPVIESGAERGDGAAFRARHDIDALAPLLVVLPGSRRGETSRLLPVFAQTVGLLASRFPGLRVVVPTVETVATEVTSAVAGWSAPTLVVRGRVEKYDAFAAADAALAASGTVALELALAALPNVVGYRVAPATAMIMRRLLKIKRVNLVNILLDRYAVPEFLQDDCRPDRLAEALATLFDDPAARAAQRADLALAMRRLGVGGESPSRRAADIVLATIAKGPSCDSCTP
ncbi:MAG: lipid-A-disaccharide synthase [Alphaproteobacteria bacterium]|nr:lipid-A-disaccharide synthase [Alphaproteobacteria bacterium]